MKKKSVKIKRSSASKRKIVRKFNPDHLGKPTIGEQLSTLLNQVTSLRIPIGRKNSSVIRGILAHSLDPKNGAW